ncbi:MAG: hypothetical protein IKG70_09915 [Lachnospiraceae bacterium]|nr:hypothetical protein [Lachnospiraceae bacterium]
MPSANNLSLTSFIFGIVSLFCIILGFSIPVGALGTITGLLSRGRAGLDQRAKIGIALSLAGIAAGVCLIIWSFNTISVEELRQLILQYQDIQGA